jgi:hypothetical protein
MFGVLGAAPFGEVPLRSSIKLSSIKPSSSAAHGATRTFNSQSNRTLLPGKMLFPILEATPFLGAQGPAVEPVRLMGAPVYGQRSNPFLNLGQKAGVTCEQTPDGGAVCSDGTYQSPTCGDPQKIASAVPAGSTEKAVAGGSSSFVPVAVGVGILGLAAYFFLG